MILVTRTPGMDWACPCRRARAQPPSPVVRRVWRFGCWRCLGRPQLAAHIYGIKKPGSCRAKIRKASVDSRSGLPTMCTGPRLSGAPTTLVGLASQPLGKKAINLHQGACEPTVMVSSQYAGSLRPLRLANTKARISHLAYLTPCDHGGQWCTLVYRFRSAAIAGWQTQKTT